MNDLEIHRIYEKSQIVERQKQPVPVGTTILELAQKILGMIVQGANTGALSRKDIDDLERSVSQSFQFMVEQSHPAVINALTYEALKKRTIEKI